MATDRYLLLERYGNNKQTAVFDMRLIGKKVVTKCGNKGQKMQKKTITKKSNNEAMALFNDKRKQKLSDGYRIIKEEDRNGKVTQIPKNNSLSDALPISGKSIANPNGANQVHSGNVKSFSFTFGQKQKHKQSQLNSTNQKLAKIRQQLQDLNTDGANPHRNHASQNLTDDDSSATPGPHRNGHAVKKVKKEKKKGQKRAGRRRKNPKNRRKESHTESSVTSSMISVDEEQENRSKTANGYHRSNGHSAMEPEFDEEERRKWIAAAQEMDAQMMANLQTVSDDDTYHSHLGSSDDDTSINRGRRNRKKGRKQKGSTEDTDIDGDEEEEDEEEEEDGSGSDSDSNSSVQSGRASDDDYEMDYEKMGGVMRSVLAQKVDYKKLEWKPLKLWIRFDEYHDTKGEYAMAPQPKRIAGSCHELLVIYMRSSSFQHEKDVVYKRLLKLARDPEEDNKHHFETERKVSQYLYKMALMVNQNFETRSDVCIWPVETVQFKYKGQLKWATIQPPFLPDPSTNNIFVKIEPNSGKPCVDDPVVGRYQHLFAAITRGLDLIRDWQGYGTSQSTFLSVCNKFKVNKEAVSQIKIRKNQRMQRQTQVLVVIDPVLTTYNAHYETNNPTDFGVKAIDEWKMNHDCIRCRCKYFGLLSTECTPVNPEGMQFGIADPDQRFFDQETISKEAFKAIQKCRYSLDIWCGDDAFDDLESVTNVEEEDGKDDI